MKKHYVKFKQTDVDGKEHFYKEWFENSKARKNFIRQLELSSRHTGLPFEIVDTWEE